MECSYCELANFPFSVTIWSILDMLTSCARRNRWATIWLSAYTLTVYLAPKLRKTKDYNSLSDHRGNHKTQGSARIHPGGTLSHGPWYQMGRRSGRGRPLCNHGRNT